jgi:hypothetical protein
LLIGRLLSSAGQYQQRHRDHDPKVSFRIYH